jgi:HSP20 family molecular chaperone IbpA
MKRSYYVGDLKLDDIEGTFDNGILNIDIPKSATKEPEKRYLELK